MKIAILVLSLLSFQIAHSQTEVTELTEVELEIMEVVNRLFKGMKDSDSSLANSAFYPDATMVTTYFDKDTDAPKKHIGSLDKFMEAVGTPKEDVWDERISFVVIQNDDNLAQVWMDYQFYLNDVFSHCGVNSIQLIRDENGWRISAIADTRRPNGC
jgi:Putative lumazine-binding